MTQQIWIGGTYGLFLTGTNWSPNGIPGTIDDVLIASPATEVAFQGTTGDGVYTTINSLGLVAGDTLSISSANTLSILDSGTSSTNAGLILLTQSTYRDDRLFLAGAIDNSGTVLLAGTSSNSVYFDGAGTLTGGGTIALSAPFAVLGLSAGVTLDNVDNLIVGSGEIFGSNGSALVNAGTIDGNGTAYALRVYASSSVITNTGLLEGTATKGLTIQGSVLNTGGTIAAIGSGAGVQLSQAYITGGTLASAGGGVVNVYASGGTLDNVVNTGSILVSDVTRYGSFLKLADDFTNRGTLSVIQTAAVTTVNEIAELFIDTATVTLTGGGTIALNGARILSLVNGATLDNVDNVIIGNGIADYGYPDKLALINGGTIDASVAGKSLFIEPFSGFTNTGLIEATNSSSLSIETVEIGSITNTGGTIGAFGSGAVVLLSGPSADLQGGTLETSGGGVIQIYSGGFDGSGTHPLTITAGSTIGDNHTATLALLGVINEGGTITGSAALAVNGTVAIGTGGRVSAGGGLVGSSGLIALASGAVLATGSAVSAGQTILFGGTGDTLVLSAPAAFAGTLSGFGSTGTIDLAGITATSATLAGTALTLLDGATDLGAIALADFAGGTFATSSDDAGGTDITVQGSATGAKTWDGPAAGSFLTDADWLPTGVPVATDDVTIASGADVTVPATASAALSINSLTLAAGNTLSIDGAAFTILDTVTSNDPAGTSSNAGTIAVGAAALAIAGTLAQSGAIEVAGTLALGAADIAGGTVAVAAAGLLTSTGATLSGGGTVMLSTGAVVSGSRLDNAGDAILGAGSLGDGGLSIVNEAAGVIDSTTGPLTLDAGAGGTIANAGLIAANGFSLTLDAGSLANTGTIAALGAGLTVAAGPDLAGTLSTGTWIANAATLTLAGSGGPITDDAADITLSGNTAAFLSGPSATPLPLSLLHIDPAGTLDLAAGQVFSTGLALTNAGTLVLAGGTFATAATFTNQGLVTGSGTVSGTTANAGTIAAAGPLLSLGPVSGTGLLEVGGSFDLSLGGATSGSVEFTGPGTLTVDAVQSFAGTIAGFGHGDIIDLATIAAIGSISFNPASDLLSLYSVRSASTGSGGAPSLAATVTLAGTYSAADFGFRPDTSGQGTDILPCFLAGTRLLTARGEIPVEEVRVGDIAITRSGPRPVVWIGHRTVTCTNHPEAPLVRPIRIRAGAFGDRQPLRDLLLSPDHSVSWDGVLIPARLLLNGASVVQERPAHAQYFHVELDAHDLVLSEGLWTESYLDTGNRAQFAAGEAWTRERAYACAELCCAGPRLTAARAHLLSRTPALGFEPGTPMLSVQVGDRQFRAARTRGDLHRFLLPPGTGPLTILSSTGAVADDHRVLGACIAGIVAAGRPIHLDHPALQGGFYPREHNWRWTDGAAHLNLAPTEAELVLDLRVKRVVAGLRRKVFFFEKKKQKTFATWGR